LDEVLGFKYDLQTCKNMHVASSIWMKFGVGIGPAKIPKAYTGEKLYPYAAFLCLVHQPQVVQEQKK
jgi:hypothetical protein